MVPLVPNKKAAIVAVMLALPAPALGQAKTSKDLVGTWAVFYNGPDWATSVPYVVSAQSPQEWSNSLQGKLFVDFLTLNADGSYIRETKTKIGDSLVTIPAPRSLKDRWEAASRCFSALPPEGTDSAPRATPITPRPRLLQENAPPGNRTQNLAIKRHEPPASYHRRAFYFKDLAPLPRHLYQPAPAAFVTVVGTGRSPAALIRPVYNVLGWRLSACRIRRRLGGVAAVRLCPPEGDRRLTPSP